MRWSRRRRRSESLACQELVELVSDYIEGALPPDLLSAFQDHISECGNCTEYLRQMRRTIELERQVGRQPISQPGAPGGDTAQMLDMLLVEFRTRHSR